MTPLELLPSWMMGGSVGQENQDSRDIFYVSDMLHVWDSETEAGR